MPLKLTPLRVERDRTDFEGCIRADRLPDLFRRRSLAASVGAHPAPMVRLDRHRFLYLWQHERHLVQQK